MLGTSTRLARELSIVGLETVPPRCASGGLRPEVLKAVELPADLYVGRQGERRKWGRAMHKHSETGMKGLMTHPVAELPLLLAAIDVALAL